MQIWRIDHLSIVPNALELLALLRQVPNQKLYVFWQFVTGRPFFATPLAAGREIHVLMALVNHVTSNYVVLTNPAVGPK